MSEQGRGAAGTISNALLGQGTANGNSQFGQAGLMGSNALTQGGIWSDVLGSVAGQVGEIMNSRRRADPLDGLY